MAKKTPLPNLFGNFFHFFSKSFVIPGLKLLVILSTERSKFYQNIHLTACTLICISIWVSYNAYNIWNCAVVLNIFKMRLITWFSRMESLTMYQTGTKGPASIVNILTYCPRKSIVHNKGLYQWLNLSLDLSKIFLKNSIILKILSYKDLCNLCNKQTIIKISWNLIKWEYDA